LNLQGKREIAVCVVLELLYSCLVFSLLTMVNHYRSGRIGDIQYDLTREFWGSIEMVGESICVNGKIHGALPSAETNQYAQMYHDDQAMQETEIGYFTMIDAVASDGIEGVKGTLHP